MAIPHISLGSANRIGSVRVLCVCVSISDICELSFHPKMTSPVVDRFSRRRMKTSFERSPTKTPRDVAATAPTVFNNSDLTTYTPL